MKTPIEGFWDKVSTTFLRSMFFCTQMYLRFYPYHAIHKVPQKVSIEREKMRNRVFQKAKGSGRIKFNIDLIPYP
jgi:hypothetical protein